MRPTDILEYTFSDFSSNKFKTMMSSLGIIIGVMAIVVMLTLGDGLYSGVSQQFGDLDVDQMILVPAGAAGQSGGASISFGGRQTGEGARQVHRPGPAHQLRGPGVTEVTPKSWATGTATYNEENRSLTLEGVRPAREAKLARDIDKGRF